MNEMYECPTATGKCPTTNLRTATTVITHYALNTTGDGHQGHPNKIVGEGVMDQSY